MEYLSYCSTEIRFASKEDMKRKLLSFDVKSIVLILSASACSRWGMQQFIEELGAKYEMVWIKDIAANPTQRDVIDTLQQIGGHPVDMIFAFGGGSSIDLAKAISAFYDSSRNSSYTVDEITDSIKQKGYKAKVKKGLGDGFIDIIAVPSTAGTGSEVTQWATIWDENKTGKFSIDDPRLKPRMALIVPELTLTLSAELTLATGFDALSHAVEAYWSKHSTPLAQETAYRAVELVVRNLGEAVQQPKDIKVREKLCRASLLAGLAFSQTRTTACHSISYPLTMLYGVSHGFAAAITLDAVGSINKGHFPNEDELFGLFRESGGILNWIDDTCEGVIKMRLSTFGIKEKDIPIIANNAFTGGRMDNNPVDMSIDDVVGVLTSIL